MEKLNFTENEKEVAKLMYEMYKVKGIVDLTLLLRDVAFYLNIVSCITKKECPKINFASLNSDCVPFKDASAFISTINFLKKLIDEKYLYSCVTGKKITNIDDAAGYGLPDKHEIIFDNSKKFTIKEGKNIVKEGSYYHFNISDDLYLFLEYERLLVLDSELIHYIENEFKTDDEIQFDRQMSKAKWANGIAFGTAIVMSLLNIAAIVANICVAYYVPTTIKDDNIDSLRQSIESTKSVKVENDTFAINAKVDTVTVKQAVKPVTKKKKTNK